MNNVLISDTLKSAFQEQIAAERYNATVYLYIAGWFRSHGCENIASFFLKQHDEETAHSLMIFDLLTDLNVFPDIPNVDGCNMEFPDIKFVADLFLQREIETTNSLNALKQLSIDENNPVAEECMRQMLIIQQSEYSEATTFMDLAENIGDDLGKLSLWDLSLNDK